MCLVTFAYRQLEDVPLILFANRDEFRMRSAQPAHVWEDTPLIYGGRDLVSGGSWLTISTIAPHRLACVTNVREPNRDHHQDDAQTSAQNGASDGLEPRSRGWLVRDFTRSELSCSAFLEEIALEEYGACNLILFDGEALWYASNRAGGGSYLVTSRALKPGIYGLSNAQLDTPWPKTSAMRRALESALTRSSLERVIEHEPLQQSDDDEALYRSIKDQLWLALSDPHTYPDDLLPDTGVPLELERTLSAACITGDHYGTRSQASVIIRPNGARFEERLLNALGDVTHRSERFFGVSEAVMR